MQPPEDTRLVAQYDRATDAWELDPASTDWDPTVADGLDVEE